MKNKKRPLLLMKIINFILLFALITGTAGYVSGTDAPAQPLTITGQVLDALGNPLPGANISIKGGNVGTITNLEGEYSIQVTGPDAILVFSFVGYLSQEIQVGNQREINVNFQEDALGLEEVVVVGYGTQKKGILTGSVSSVESEKLTQASFSTTSNALTGRLPGLIAVQSSGQPGLDAATLTLRGFGAPLVIVDGVETDLNTIDPDQIESVTLLKDGAASIYGSRAGNGVILVTTKRGTIQKPIFSFSTALSGQGIIDMPRMASSGQIAEMKREQHLQSGKPEETAPYTEEQIQKYYDGSDPQYPNTDWYDVLIKDWAPQQKHNLSVRGGSEAIKYYGYLGYLKQETFWKSGKGGSFDRFNFQSNIDARILDNLSLQVDVASTWEDFTNTRRQQNQPDGASLWQDFWATEPMFPATLPDPAYNAAAGGAGTGGVHLSANTDISGYNINKENTLKGTISLDYQFKSINGLSAKALVNLLEIKNRSKGYSKPYDFYTYDYASEVYSRVGGLTNSDLNEGYWENRVLTGQVYLKYENVFADVHRVSAMAISEMIDYNSNYFSAGRQNFLSPEIDYLFGGSTETQSNNGGASEMGRSSYIGRLNYAYKDKYLLESIIRADASAKFPEEKRWGYFPSISVGWVLSEESFMQNLTYLDRMKLRASYGESGRDAVGNFQYLAGYQLNSRTYIFGSGPLTGILPTGLANPNLTWESNTIYNLGLDFSLFSRHLYGEVDVFYRTREGIPATRATSLPSTFGANLPPENLNSLNNRGFEFLLGTRGESGELSWDISANLSWSRAKWDHFEEPEYADPDQERISKNSGQWTDRYFGYLSDGLFTSQDQIDNLPFDQDLKGNTTLKPGDIRYFDVNSDSVLDWKDQVELGGGTTPHWITGFNVNLRYRDFDFSALLQGAFGYYHRINFNKLASQNPPVEYYNQRWTEENNDPDAFFPRLGGAATNAYVSDHFYKQVGYLRLKVLNIGYNLPSPWLNKVNINNLRVYVSGINLLTYNPLKDYGVDPEAPNQLDGYYYPQQRTITVGLDISF